MAESHSKTERKVTLADVAAHAGVSVQTVSHVLAGTTGVRISEATREKILWSASDLGYRPNRLAQAMKAGKTQIIDVWFPNDRANWNYLLLIQAISRELQASGYEMLLTGLNMMTAYGVDHRKPNTWPVDGLIAIDCGQAVEMFRADPRNDSTPIMVYGLEEFENGDSILHDVVSAARKIVGTLISEGRRKIAHLTPQWVVDNFPVEQRRRGYSEVMTEHGLEPLILPTANEHSPENREIIRNYLQEHDLDAIFAFTDNIACDVLAAALSLGIRVPDDLAIWGFGNLPESAVSEIRISTVGAPIDEMVNLAWTWLHERIHSEGLETRVRLVEMDLIRRESS